VSGSSSLFRLSSHRATFRAEAAIALRQRLNETIEQLDTLRKEYAELDVKYEQQSKELTIVKSDCAFSFF
jgi:hypothetical protein